MSRFRIALVWLVAAVCLGSPAGAAPPPDADGRYADWFRSLTVPGLAGAPCCSVADCRMVNSRWNAETRHHEAKVSRDTFGNGLKHPIASQEDEDAVWVARQAWLKRWLARFGDQPDAWIDIPEAKVNPVKNPTGRAVLCWSVFSVEFNGVYCFMPFQAAFDEYLARRHG